MLYISIYIYTLNILCQIQEADPSSEGSIRYKKALEELDRVHEITKKLTGYVSSDSEDETGE